MRPRHLALLPALAAALAACESVPDPLSVDGTGQVLGQAYLDRNGSGTPDAGDRPYRNLTVTLADWGSGRAVATATTDTAGVYRFAGVPIGRYRVRVDAAQLGDTVRVIAGGDSAVTVAVSDSLAPQVRLGIGYPPRTIAQVRALPAGRPVLFTARVAGMVGDTAYLWDGARAIRAPDALIAAQTTAAALAGDSVRVVGRTARPGGVVALDSAVVFPLAALPPLDPVALTSAAASAAGAGAYDAAPVRLAAVTVLDTVTHDGNGWLRVDDGSGTIEVRLGPGVRFALTPYVPGVVLNVAGVLEPLGGGWTILPRANADLEILADTPSVFRPAVPKGLAATAADSTVTLAWTDSSTNETRFEVERRGAGVAVHAKVGETAAGDTSYTETGVGNVTYGYRVRACNGLVCSAWTEEVTVATVPAAPIDLQAFPRTLAVQLFWRDQSRVESRYEIQRHQHAGPFADAGTTEGDVQQFLDEGRAAGTAYVYRIRACNAAGCSPWTPEATATPVS